MLSDSTDIMDSITSTKNIAVGYITPLMSLFSFMHQVMMLGSCLLPWVVFFSWE